MNGKADHLAKGQEIRGQEIHGQYFQSQEVHFQEVQSRDLVEVAERTPFVCTRYVCVVRKCLERW